MKKLLFILSITIIGCTSTNENQSKQIANYKKVIKQLYHQNVFKVRMLDKAISDNGYRKDTVYLNAAIEVLNNSDAVVNKNQSLDKHYEYIIEKYNLVESKDTASLTRAHVFLEQFNQNKDSIYYYNYLLNALLLESDIMDFYCAQMGADRVVFYTTIFKESDTARVNDLYTFIVTPADYRYAYSKMIVDSLIEITLDDKKINLPMHFKQIGGAIIVTLTPTQKGKYFVKGKISVVQKYGLATEDVYSNLFYVK